MSTTPNLTLRYDRQVELVMPHRRDLSAFQVGAANTLDAAFAGSTAMFQVRSGQTFRSPSVRRAHRGATQYTNRGLTRAAYDPQDYWVAAGALPADTQQAYVRVAEVDLDGNVLGEGPIFVVPRGGWNNTPRPTMTLSGTAPSVTLPADGTAPPTAMHVVLPQFSDNLRIQNLSTTAPLYIAFGPGEPLIQIGFDTTGYYTEVLYDGTFKELFLCGSGGTVAFDICASLVNGEMA